MDFTSWLAIAKSTGRFLMMNHLYIGGLNASGPHLSLSLSLSNLYC